MKIKAILKTSVWICTALWLVSCARIDQSNEIEETIAESDNDEFSVFATNDKGERLDGIKSETDGEWYLFVPSTEVAADLTFHYTGGVTDVVQQREDKMKVTVANGENYTVTIKQSKLPSLQIYLKDITLDQLHQDKEVKYKNNAVVLGNPKNQDDFLKTEVEMKGRGNSTWKFWEKRGYQIKFEEKTSVLGMNPAKKWVLLANAADDSMMRSQLIFRLAKNFDMKYVPAFEYVDLWIDGEYRGLYLIGEKPEIGKSRLYLENPEGAMFEQDVGFYEEEEHWFYSETLKRQFTLKDIKEETPDNIKKAMNTFQTSIDDLMNWLYTSDLKQITLDELNEKIDVDSFIKYYLINEYVLNRESFESSFYWYQDGEADVLHVGPIWDFDTCLGNDAGVDVEGKYGYKHTVFAYLLEIPEFLERGKELYDQYKYEFANMIDDADNLKAQIEDSVQMNYLRWDLLGKPNPKPPLADYHNTFEESVLFIQDWLKQREKCFVLEKN